LRAGTTLSIFDLNSGKTGAGINTRFSPAEPVHTKVSYSHGLCVGVLRRARGRAWPQQASGVATLSATASPCGVWQSAIVVSFGAIPPLRQRFEAVPMRRTKGGALPLVSEDQTDKPTPVRSQARNPADLGSRN
jgi:hypothetical protein